MYRKKLETKIIFTVITVFFIAFLFAPLLMLSINSFKGEKKTIKLHEINVQNRAGRGKNLTSALIDDYVESVILVSEKN